MSTTLYIGVAVSYEEKGSWVYLLVTAVTYVAYVVIVVGRAGATPLADVDYVPTMLGTIGVAIGLTIVGRIAIEIAKPSDTYKIDARDREIGRFGEYVGGTVLAVGMLVPFGLAMAEAAHFWIANAIYLVFVVYSLVGATIKLLAYRRGL
jgi:hypothetical protein